MLYQDKDYNYLIGGISGLSESLLKNHLALYQGYVKNTNLLFEKIAEMPKDLPEYGELKRRFGWEFNGMRLHELYFENISQTPGRIEDAPEIFNKIQLDFGSVEKWEEDFKALGAVRGIGWAVLYHDKWQDRLFNVWINEHDMGHLAGCRPLIVMDLFEHAFMPDNLRRPEYVDIFLKHLDWNSANDRMKAIS